MGNNRLFWSQDTMDEWVVEDKASIKNNLLILKDEPVKYRLSQAVHFVADVGDGDDANKLVGRVKEIASLEEMGAEHYMDSVLIEDSAYQVVSGFTGEPVADEAKKSEGGDITGAVKTKAGDDKEEDRELLAKFLLDNL